MEEEKENMLERITVEEFKSTGLILYINQILQPFGVSLAYDKKEENGKEIFSELYPVKTKFRGFSEDSVDSSYESIKKYLRQNIDFYNRRLKGKRMKVYLEKEDFEKLNNSQILLTVQNNNKNELKEIFYEVEVLNLETEKEKYKNIFKQSQINLLKELKGHVIEPEGMRPAGWQWGHQKIGRWIDDNILEIENS